MSAEPVLDSDILAYYDQGRERSRLETTSRLEYVRTRELLDRFLPRPPARVLDVGGGAGAYAVPLIESGYDVTLVVWAITESRDRRSSILAVMGVGSS